MTIDRAEYAAAIAKLLQVAQQSTSGGRAAAQVLLSAYNGFDFQADIASLGNLDRANHALAMTVIQGRYDTGCEPHELIADGSRVFHDLRTQWSRLHVQERGKMECPACDGRGTVYLNSDDEDDLQTKSCTRCDGSGRVCMCGR